MRSRGGEGVVVRHARGCPAGDGGGRCGCRPAFQAQVYVAGQGRTIRKTFQSLAEARAWRAQSQTAIRRGTMSLPSKITVAQAAAEWLADAERGVARTRSGESYKPSALRAYRGALDVRILPAFGRLRLSALSRVQLQDLADEMVADGLAPSTVRNMFLPVRVIYRRAVHRGEVSVNPTIGLVLPAVRGRRERVARPHEASALLAALDPADRVIYATALYAGLRRGELQGLQWRDVDFENGVIRVVRSWDDHAGPIAPKSRAGVRNVPLIALLRGKLIAHRLRQTHTAPEDRVFLSDRGKPFAWWVSERANRRWLAVGLEPIGLHECRHTFAAFMIASNVNAKALSTFMGHSSIVVTLDRYGHLMPGDELQAADALQHYLNSNNMSVAT